MKIRSLFLFFLVSPFILVAQTNTPYSGFRLGLKGGANMSNYLVDSLNNQKRATLPFIGLQFDKDFSKYLGFKTDLLFSPRGSNGLQPYAKVRYSYLDLGLTLHFRPIEFLSFYTGVQPSMILSSKIKYHSNSDSIVNIPLKNSQIDWYAIFGAELMLQKGIAIGFNYQMPVGTARFNNYQLYLNVLLDKNLLKKKSNQKEELAYVQIREMKNSAVLVRLKTSQNKINALLIRGETDEANRIREEQKKENLRIVNAFRKNFNFCPVFFFFSNNSTDIKQGKIQGHLLNDELDADSGIAFPYSSFYVIEFDNLLQQKNELNYQTVNDTNSKNVIESQPGAGQSVEALVVRNSSFLLLESPFPYAVRMTEYLSKRKKEQVISILNQRLHYFYKEAENP